MPAVEFAKALRDRKLNIDTSAYVSRLKSSNSNGTLNDLFAVDRTTGVATPFSMSAFGSGKAGDPLNLWHSYQDAKVTDPSSGHVIAVGCNAACRLGLADNNQQARGAVDAIPTRDVVQEVGKRGEFVSIPVESNVAMLNRIDEELASGRVVMVGASYEPGTQQLNGDSVTDHFFLIFGRTTGKNGEVQYLFVDNATSQMEGKIGALNVNPIDGTIFSEQSAVGFIVVTQVR